MSDETSRNPALPAARVVAELPRKTITLGVVSLAFGVLTTVLLFLGIGMALSGSWAASITVGYIAVAASALAIATGLFAATTGRGRWWGVAGVVLGVAANPLLLTRLLGWMSGLG